MVNYVLIKTTGMFCSALFTGHKNPFPTGYTVGRPERKWDKITFATVRHRTGKTKGYLSRKTGLAIAFKLMMSEQTK